MVPSQRQPGGRGGWPASSRGRRVELARGLDGERYGRRAPATSEAAADATGRRAKLTEGARNCSSDCPHRARLRAGGMRGRTSPKPYGCNRWRKSHRAPAPSANALRLSRGASRATRGATGPARPRRTAPAVPVSARQRPSSDANRPRPSARRVERWSVSGRPARASERPPNAAAGGHNRPRRCWPLDGRTGRERRDTMKAP